MRCLKLSVLVGCVFVFAGAAHGQTDRKAADPYPAKTVRLMIPFGTGSGADIIGRLMADKLSQTWRRPVVVENRPGATGSIAAEYVARAEPDGYTLLLGNIATHGVNPPLFGDKLRYDALADFAPVVLLARTSLVLVANPALPAKTMQELIALAKAEPGKLNYASAGVGSGSHMPTELLELATGIKMVHVPYKGSGAAMTALLGGEVQLAFTGPLSVLPLLKAGRLRALAVTSTKRTPTLPEVPTIAETVAPGYEADLWFGVLAPARTPVVSTLNSSMNAALAAPDIQARMLEQDVEPVGGTPDQFAAFIKAEIAKWTRIVNATGIKPE